MEIKGVNHITVTEFQANANNFLLVDVRPDYELSKLFEVPKLVYLAYTNSDDEFKALPTNENLVIADAVGLRSKELCLRLTQLGYKQVCNLVGGVVEWERKGFPISTDKNTVLTGSCMCQLQNRNV